MTLRRRTMLTLTAAALAGGVLTTTAAPASASDGFASTTTVHNTPPATPTGQQLYPDGGCAATAPGTYLNPARLNDAGRVLFQATLSDPDEGDQLTAEFANWPVADPSARQTLQVPANPDGTVLLQANDWPFAEDGTYAWTVRALDGTAASAETAPCYLTIDRTPPTTPSVTSAVYPPGVVGGGYGVPGQFTFTTASDDVVAYEYRWQNTGDWISAAPTTLGGPVTITYTPDHAGYDFVDVRAVDRAGNRSSETFYSFDIFENRPFVFSSRYPSLYTNLDGGVGVPGQFEFSSNLTDVASYTYQVDDGPESTVAADSERSAVITYAPVHAEYNVMKVRSTSSGGISSPEAGYRFMVDDAPIITLSGQLVVGSATNVTLTARQANVVSYTYWFSIFNSPDTDPVTVPAAADGTATFSWTPLTNDVRTLHVRSTDGAGEVSQDRSDDVYVDGAAPHITATGADSPVRTGTLSFATSMVSPVEYEYWFDDAPTVKYTVPAGPDGRATVAYTPDHTGLLVLRARARNAAGVWSMEGAASWSVSDQPDVSSADFPTWSATPSHTGTFTFTANQPGAGEFEYTIDGRTATVPLGADGTATVSWTPPQAGDHYVIVSSRTAAGARSASTSYSFRTTDPAR